MKLDRGFILFLLPFFVACPRPSPPDVVRLAVPDVVAQTVSVAEIPPLDRSVAARPSWASAAVPQIENAGRLFSEASAANAQAAARGLLLCRVHAESNRGADLRGAMGILTLGAFRDPDMDLALRLGSGRTEVLVSAPEDTRTAYVSAPGFFLTANAPMELEAWDRDVLDREYMGKLETVWNGNFPLNVANTDLRLECGALPEPVVRREAQRVFQQINWHPGQAADAVVTAGLAPDAVRVPVLRPEQWPGERRRVGRDRIASIAAWFGWAHTEVQQLVVRENSLTDGDRALVREWLRGARNETRGATGITLRSFQCGERALRALRIFAPPETCAAVLEVPAAMAMPLNESVTVRWLGDEEHPVGFLRSGNAPTGSGARRTVVLKTTPGRNRSIEEWRSGVLFLPAELVGQDTSIPVPNS